jgi:hypothetical protein
MNSDFTDESLNWKKSTNNCYKFEEKVLCLKKSGNSAHSCKVSILNCLQNFRVPRNGNMSVPALTQQEQKLSATEYSEGENFKFEKFAEKG